MAFPTVSLALALLSAATAEPTAVAIVPSPVGPDGAHVLRYSQAVVMQAILVGEEGPIAGERLTFTLTDVSTGESFIVDDPLTDALGFATLRVTFVDGRYGGQTFLAADVSVDAPGHGYRVSAQFFGDLDASDPLCTDLDAGTPDDAGPVLRCSSATTAPLYLQRENVSLRIQPGNVVPLGGEITLAAILADENGDAPLAGTEVDGTAEKRIPNVELAFFFDLNGNERPEAGELLGRGTTDGNGVARLTFVVDPAIYPSGDFANGIHAQFGGDDRYALAGAGGRITVEGGAPVPSNTIIEADPEEAPADGLARITLKAILVDEGQNPLGSESPPVSVRFTSTLGTVLEEEALYDVLTGHYTQEVRAPETGGSATVTVIVGGEDGATRTITWLDDGCACAETGGAPSSSTAFAIALLFAGTRLRRRPASFASPARPCRSPESR
jgi:MYXO-CTERM domain-containing protein